LTLIPSLRFLQLSQNVISPVAAVAQVLETANAACAFSTVHDVSVSPPSDVLSSDVEMVRPIDLNSGSPVWMLIRQCFVIQIGESDSLGASIVEAESLSPMNAEALPIPSTAVFAGNDVNSDDVEVVSLRSVKNSALVLILD
jgi:hypothetical protein